MVPRTKERDLHHHNVFRIHSHLPSHITLCRFPSTSWLLTFWACSVGTTHTHTPKQSLITEAAQCPLVRIDNPDHNVLLQYAVFKLPFFGFSISSLSFSLSLRLCPSLLGSVSPSGPVLHTFSFLFWSLFTIPVFVFAGQRNHWPMRIHPVSLLPQQ